MVLGIPSIPATALLLSALLIHGIQPGPQLVSDHPHIFWGLIASMYIGNLILVLLNLPMVGLFVNLLRIPAGILSPSVLLISMIGVYAVAADAIDIWFMVAAGLVGYVLRKYAYDVALLLLALVLGERIETNFRRALTISDGDYSIFISGAGASYCDRLRCGLMLAARFLGWRRPDALPSTSANCRHHGRARH